MLIFPAIDLYEGQAVRLYKGDYSRKTVYSDRPWEVALKFRELGATHMHIVDLEGARDGQTPNYGTVCRIKNESGLFCELGGGIRSLSVIEKYVSAGIDRLILVTAAVTDTGFVREAVENFGDAIAVGADLRDGNVAIKGWTEASGRSGEDFIGEMLEIGVRTVICTDISRDGAMQGTNRELYKALSDRFDMNFIASGGVSSIDDVRALREMNLYGAIIGKAYYTGDIMLDKAIEVAR